MENVNVLQSIKEMKKEYATHLADLLNRELEKNVSVLMVIIREFMAHASLSSVLMVINGTLKEDSVDQCVQVTMK